MIRRRKNQIVVHTDVEIWIDDVLEELSDEDIIEEAARRKLEAKVANKVKAEGDPLEMLEEVMEALRRRDVDEATFLLDRIMNPKFRSLKMCEAAFKKALPPRTPAGSSDQA